GERVLDSTQNKFDRAVSHCFRGHLLLAMTRTSGQDGIDGAGSSLEHAEAMAAALQAGADSLLGKAVLRLRRAVAAFEAGQHERLFRGHLPEDLPEALRQALATPGQ